MPVVLFQACGQVSVLLILKQLVIVLRDVGLFGLVVVRVFPDVFDNLT